MSPSVILWKADQNGKTPSGYSVGLRAKPSVVLFLKGLWRESKVYPVFSLVAFQFRASLLGEAEVSASGWVLNHSFEATLSNLLNRKKPANVPGVYLSDWE